MFNCELGLDPEKMHQSEVEGKHEDSQRAILRQRTDIACLMGDAGLAVFVFFFVGNAKSWEFPIFSVRCAPS